MGWVRADGAGAFEAAPVPGPLRYCSGENDEGITILFSCSESS